MAERKRRRTQEEEATELPGEGAQRARTASQVVLELQRSAGNQAVAALLARQPAAEPEAHGTQIIVEVEGVGEFEAQSLNVSEHEVQVTKATDKTSVELMKRAQSGAAVSVKIRMLRDGKPVQTITVKGVVSSFQSGGGGDAPVDQVSFSGEITPESPEKEGVDLGAPAAL